MNKLPSKSVLMDAIIDLFATSGSTVLSTKEINDKVAEQLKIPNELLMLEDSNCTGTEYSYRMRWARTELKSKNKLKNIQRGQWAFISPAEKD
jgi:hypothetical protein